MIVTIHQPAFFPWWPFFLKIQEADVFVVMRHCQFEKNGFQNRFYYNDEWLTMSTKKGLDPIIDKRYIDPHNDWKKIKRKLEKFKFLSEFDDDICDSLWETNFNIIKRICKIFDLKTKIVLDNSTNLKSTERLVDICKNLSATQYLSGQSGQNYLDASLFQKANIQVKYQKIDEFDKVHTLDKIYDKLSSL